jgi:predicted outer membrane protein
MVGSLALASTTLLVAGAPVQAAAVGGDMPVGDRESKHITDTLKIGTLSLAVSRLALKKASGAGVTGFAKFEVAEQETVGDVLMSMEKPADKAKGMLAVPSDAALDELLDADGTATLTKFQGLTGADFTTQYVAAQIEGHTKLLAIQEDYLRDGKNREHLDVAKLARGMIKEHLTLLASLKARGR